jgi:predicted RNA-binding Zn-ribbon protein involved in translation (DUF1610 family)
MEENNTLKARLKAITEAQFSKCPKCGTGDFVVTRKERLRGRDFTEVRTYSCPDCNHSEDHPFDIIKKTHEM